MIDPPTETGLRPDRLSVRYIGGPTALLELGGIRMLTDPTFDPPGDHPVGDRILVKTAGPAVDLDSLGPLDVVLLSHDQHPDNLDTGGRELLALVPLVLSTASAHDRLAGTVRTLPNWETIEVPRPDGDVLRITGVPAQHGPDGSEHLVGEVTGFVLTGNGFPTVYVSGDNASLEIVRAIADRLGRVDVALLFAGAARTSLAGGAYLTLTSDAAAEAAGILGARAVAPLHFEGWSHFTQGADALLASFERVGLGARLRLPKPGERIEL